MSFPKTIEINGCDNGCKTTFTVSTDIPFCDICKRIYSAIAIDRPEKAIESTKFCVRGSNKNTPYEITDAIKDMKEFQDNVKFNDFGAFIVIYVMWGMPRNVHEEEEEISL